MGYSAHYSTPYGVRWLGVAESTLPNSVSRSARLTISSLISLSVPEVVG